MPRSDEYSAVGGGGKLKLKGSKVKDGRVDKKKKKKDKDKDKDREQEDSLVSGSLVEERPDKLASPGAERIDSDDRERDRSGQEEEAENGSNGVRTVNKTEAERRYEEQKRKRLNERLKREGIKTHKERVEELNRYLSNLSEHHDMPKIGPG